MINNKLLLIKEAFIINFILILKSYIFFKFIHYYLNS